jgi:hypothetical protein
VVVSRKEDLHILPCRKQFESIKEEKEEKEKEKSLDSHV